MRLNHMHAVMALKKAKPINEGCMLETPCFLLRDRCTGTLCSEEIEIGLIWKTIVLGLHQSSRHARPYKESSCLAHTRFA